MIIKPFEFVALWKSKGVCFERTFLSGNYGLISNALTNATQGAKIKHTVFIENKNILRMFFLVYN